MKNVLKVICLSLALTLSAMAQGIEGDVTPRGNVDGVVDSTDVVQIKRFAVGIDAIQPGELQRADCAPRATLGDGVVDAADVVQVRRYVVGLDPVTPVGGPTLVTEFLENSSTTIYLRPTPKGYDVIVSSPYGAEASIGFTIDLLTRAEGVYLGETITGAALSVNSMKNSIGVLVDSASRISRVPGDYVLVSVVVSKDRVKEGGAKFSNTLAKMSSVNEDATESKSVWVDLN